MTGHHPVQQHGYKRNIKMATKKKVLPEYTIKIDETYPVRVVVIEAVLEAADMDAESAIENALDELTNCGYAVTVRNQIIDHTLKEAYAILSARHQQ
jgi:ABC-type cobalamin transport system ATPase subunit